MVTWHEAAVSAAASRASWLAELAAAVERARELSRLMSADAANPGRWREINRRLDSMRAEVDDLRHAVRGSFRQRTVAPNLRSLFDDPAKSLD